MSNKKIKPPSKYKNKIILGDAVAVLKKMPNEIVDLGITSPPYNKQEKNNGGEIKDKYRSTVALEKMRMSQTPTTLFTNAPD